MSQYATQLCEALTHLLERVVTFKRHRLAGYTANLDFWADEVDHRLRLLNGWKTRRERMIAGTNKEIPPCSGKLSMEDVDTSTNWRTEERRIERLRAKLLDAARRFLRRVFEDGLIEQEKLWELEDRFGIRV
jgi:hypothetical protein